MPVVFGFVAMVLVACVAGCSDRNETSAGEAAGSGGDSARSVENHCEEASSSKGATTCVFSFGDCADGSEYAIECDITQCSCVVDGDINRTFGHSNDCQEMIADGGELAARACGFNISFDSVRKLESCGDEPNELGIGRPCLGNDECSGSTICIGKGGLGVLNICTIPCESSSECGQGVQCLEISGVYLCLPPSCEALIEWTVDPGAPDGPA